MINMWKTINEEDKMNGSDNGLFITTSIGDFENKKILRTIVETYSDGFCVNTSVAIVEISDVPPTSQTEKNDSKKEEDRKTLDEMNKELSKMTTIVDCANLITTQKYKNFEKSCSLEFLDEFKTLKKSHVDRCAINDLSFDLACVRNKKQLDELLKFYPRFAQEDEKIKQMIQDIECNLSKC